MSKTPISLLQELLIKQGYFPIYDYIGEETDGVYRFFIYKVTCKDLSAKGIGNNKKMAKHDAAKNMLSLLSFDKKNEDQMSSSSVITPFISTKSHETASSSKMQSEFTNYVGILQEFCRKQNFNISYEIIQETGPPHMKMFTTEIKVGSFQKMATAHCKKLAKQEAAKLMLQDLNKYIQIDIEKQDENVDKKNVDVKQMYEDIQKLSIEIHQCEPVQSFEEMTKRAETLFVKQKMKKEITQNYLIKDCHTLFQRKYSSKIPDSMREKMKMICDKYADQIDLIQKMIQEIESALEVKLQQININNYRKDYLICLRLTSHPNITQFGIGETDDKAKTHAMYNIILTILTFLS